MLSAFQQEIGTCFMPLPDLMSNHSQNINGEINSAVKDLCFKQEAFIATNLGSKQ